MKKIITLFVCTTIFSSIIAQTSFENRYWFGILEDASLPLNLHFEKQADSSIVPMLYSPMQSQNKLVPSSFRITTDSVFITIKSINFKAILKYNNTDSTFAGYVQQYGSKMPITLKPTDGLLEVKRPQEPMPPFDYIEEEVAIENTTDNTKLAGTLTYPKNGDKFPVAILITGSGSQNRDEEIFKHKPFKVIADYMTKNGIATLRCDDRGMGKSVGNTDANTFDLATDIECMINFLKKHHKVNPTQIGLIGHSEGGLIAPIVASRNSSVAFIIMLAGPGVDGKETLLLQNRKIYEIGNMPDSLINKRITILNEVFDLPKTTDNNNLLTEIDKIVKKYTTGKEERSAIGFSPKSVMVLANTIKLNWMKTFLYLDPCEYLSKTTCPILALNGSKDCQVLPQENIDAIKKCTNNRAETMILPNLNHLFQNCETGGANEYMMIEETFAPTVLDIMHNWILNTIKK